MKQREKGITLIALILAVIILVVLSTITIQTVHDHKIMQYSIKAKDDYLESEENENIVMEQTANVMKEWINGE